MAAPVLGLVDASAHLAARGALIGLDLGTKTIGVAVSDPDRRLAAGVETIARKSFTADAARLLALASERRAVGIVLGLPLNMDGSEGPRAQSGALDRFADRLVGRTPLDRCGRARPDRRRRQPRQARGRHRPACGRLY